MTHAALFDFDYTLGDSSQATVHCVTHALRELGLALPSTPIILQTIGLPLVEAFGHLTRGRHDPAMARLFAEKFRLQADLVMTAGTVLDPSLTAVVGQLRRNDISTGIVSTKLGYRIRGSLAANSCDRLFDVVIGGDEVALKKPHPEGILSALRQLHTDPKHAVYVGDHIVDAETAINAGVRFIAVLSGTCSEEDFAGYPSMAILKSLRELPKCILD